MCEVPFIAEGVGARGILKKLSVQIVLVQTVEGNFLTNTLDKYCTFHAHTQNLCDKREKANTLPDSKFIIYAISVITVTSGVAKKAFTVQLGT